MLFVWDRPVMTGMWMKNTLIPLDMLFVSNRGVVVRIAENTEPHSLTGIRSGGPVLGSGELRSSDHREWTLGAELELDRSDSLRHKARLTYTRHELDRRSPAIFPVVPESEEQTTYQRTRLGNSDLQIVMSIRVLQRRK